MNPSRKVNLGATAVLLTAAAASVLTLNTIDRFNTQPEAQQTLYIRSAKALRRMSLGYTGLLADIYWTRAVQYFGYQHNQRSNDFHLLLPLLQVTTELDPRLLPPYQLGATFLAPPPTPDLFVVSGDQHLGDLYPAKLGRPRVMRVVQQSP